MDMRPVSPISPQAWGCTKMGLDVDDWHKNLPTGVGMYRLPFSCLKGFAKSPHRRGDVPLKRAFDGATDQNLPIGVGMYRNRTRRCGNSIKSPHRRGDVPHLRERWEGIARISPQAWGCTVSSVPIIRSRSNLPTGVGMYRS